MLPKKHRLPLRTDLVRVQEEGNLIQGRLFSLLVLQQTSDHLRPRLRLAESGQPSRFGFIISTKIHKRATKRNRVRRLLIEAIRSFLSEIKPGFDCVFLAKKAIVGKELSEIQGEVKRLFRKGRLL